MYRMPDGGSELCTSDNPVCIVEIFDVEPECDNTDHKQFNEDVCGCEMLPDALIRFPKNLSTSLLTPVI